MAQKMEYESRKPLGVMEGVVGLRDEHGRDMQGP